MNKTHYLPAKDKQAYLDYFDDKDDLWVFAYGSLLWNPGFTVAEKRLATLHGFYRSFCLISTVHRGTPENTGLVLALDDGDECKSLVLRVAEDEKAAALSSLFDREQVTYAYLPIFAEVETEAGKIHALTFVMNKEHVQYSGKLDDDEVLERILRAHGQGGSNIEYLLNTQRHLQELGLHDDYIMRLTEQARLRIKD